MPAPTARSSRRPRVQAGRSVRCAVAAEELGPVGGPFRLPAAEVEERDPAGELGVPRVAHEHRTASPGSSSVTIRGPLSPRDVPSAHSAYAVTDRRREPAGPILDGQHRDLERIVEWHELDQVELDAVVHVLEPAVARAVPRDVG